MRDSIIEMGYETHNSLLNLGSVSIFVFLYFVALVLLGFLNIIVFSTGKGSKIYVYIKKRLIFSMLISLLMEPFMELVISAYLNIKAPLFTKNGEIIGIFTAYFMFTFACVILPLTYVWVITRNQ